MRLHKRKPAQDDLDAFQAFAASNLPSSFAFSHHFWMQRAAAARHGKTQVLRQSAKKFRTD